MKDTLYSIKRKCALYFFQWKSEILSFSFLCSFCQERNNRPEHLFFYLHASLVNTERIHWFWLWGIRINCFGPNSDLSCSVAMLFTYIRQIRSDAIVSRMKKKKILAMRLDPLTFWIKPKIVLLPFRTPEKINVFISLEEFHLFLSDS